MSKLLLIGNFLMIAIQTVAFVQIDTGLKVQLESQIEYCNEASDWLHDDCLGQSGMSVLDEEVQNLLN